MILQSIRSAIDFASHLPRYREILGVLFKYGFANELRLAALERLLGIESQPATNTKNELHSLPFAVRLRMALEELGPTFIKFGQLLSSRRDLIPDDLYAELSKLQSNVPAIPFETAAEILAEELGVPVNELFREFDPSPLGAASIAQTHRATLHDGSQVAVKIQRPGIEKIISIDLDIARDFANFLTRYVPDVAVLNPIGIVEEFTTAIRRELDFSIEASNAERFRNQFRGEPSIRVPRIYRNLSTSKVLTMEFISGFPPDDPELLRYNGIDPIALSETISNLIYRQVFEFGFFHGDPHPGNLTILEDGVVGLYDYGMMGSFSPEFRMSVARMIGGIAEKNHRAVMRSLLEMSEEGYCANPHKMLAEVESFADEYLNKPLKDINLGFVLNRLLDLLRNHHLRMKSCFYLGIKALSQVEAIGRVLNPELNFVQLGGPYAMKILIGKYRPTKVFSLIQRLFGEALDFLEEFPHDFRTLYQRIRRGDISFPLEHKIDPKGFEPLRQTLDSIANRLSNAILAASVLICSSILMLAKLPPFFLGVPLFGLIGLAFGTFMTVRLVISIWKHGGL